MQQLGGILLAWVMVLHFQLLFLFSQKLKLKNKNDIGTAAEYLAAAVALDV